jgi:hypothetical protein
VREPRSRPFQFLFCRNWHLAKASGVSAMTETMIKAITSNRHSYNGQFRQASYESLAGAFLQLSRAFHQ